MSNLGLREEIFQLCISLHKQENQQSEKCARSHVLSDSPNGQKTELKVFSVYSLVPLFFLPYIHKVTGHLFDFILTVFQIMNVLKHSHGFRKHSLFNEIITIVSKSTARRKLWLVRVLSVNTPVFTKYFLRGLLCVCSVKQATSDLYFPALQLIYLLSSMKAVLCPGCAKQPILGFYSACKCNCSNCTVH